MSDKELPTSIKQFFELPSIFEKDDSPEGEYEAVRLSQSRSSLFLDMPFFGYILGHLEIYPVNDIRIPAYAADTRRLYFNPKFTENKPKERLKGILMHLVTHLIMKHHKRMFERNSDIWNISADVTTRMIVSESYRLLTENNGIFNQTKSNSALSKTWEVDTIEKIPKTLRDTSAENAYTTLYDYAKSLVGINNEDDTTVNHPKSSINRYAKEEFDSSILDEVLDYSGIDNPCSFGIAMQELLLGMEDDLAKLEQGRFDGIIRTGWIQAKRKGTIPGAMKEIIDQLINPKLPWHALLIQYLQHTVMSDWKWVPANRRMIGMDIHLPSTIKEHLNVIIAVDTSGSISTDELTSFVTETHGIISSFSSLKMTLIDCDAKIQQVLVIEDGQSIDGSPLPWEGRVFLGRGGTSFIPVFQWVEKEGINPDILIYFTDGYGSFPSLNHNYPVLWVMTSEIEPPFGDLIRYDMKDE